MKIQPHGYCRITNRRECFGTPRYARSDDGDLNTLLELMVTLRYIEVHYHSAIRCWTKQLVADPCMISHGPKAGKHKEARQDC